MSARKLRSRKKALSQSTTPKTKLKSMIVEDSDVNFDVDQLKQRAPKKQRSTFEEELNADLSRPKPSLAAVVGCMMPFMLGVCFLCSSMDCLCHNYHYCHHCNEKLADFEKDDACVVTGDGSSKLVARMFCIACLKRMKLKQLESLLGSLQQFENPKIELEQYPTGAHIASRMLYTAENSFGDVSNKVVADFGCGCGTLGLAATLLDAEHVVGLDVDEESLEIASINANDLEVEMGLVQCEIKNLKWRGQIVDTVVMNPPFGTRIKGADMEFLSVALKVASQAVYSLHKTTTREHIKRAALRDYNASSAEVICELRYDLPKLYKFHKKKDVDIAVDLWRFVPKTKQDSSS